MDPQQEIFTALRSGIKKLGYDVYDGALPPKDTPYPFVYLADSRMRDDHDTKDAVFATVYQTVHVWHSNVRQRGTVSEMLLNIKRLAFKTKRTASYQWGYRNADQRILNDDTTESPLLHGIIEFEFKLIGGLSNEKKD